MSWNLQWQPTHKVSRTAVPSHSSAVLASGTAGATGATAGALQFQITVRMTMGIHVCGNKKKAKNRVSTYKIIPYIPIDLVGSRKT